MGIKTVITPEELSPVFPCTVLIPSEHGVSDTVYFTEHGILKLFETASPEAINEERNLLQKLSSLPVSQPLREIFFIREKPCALYRMLPGKSPKIAGEVHILQIAEFMNRFHLLSEGLTSSNPPLYGRARLQSLINQTARPEFQDIFDSIDLELSNDGVIHGDLFLDNALFEGESLSGILDFTEACEGDFLFDLAVVAISWCLDDNAHAKIALLLHHYHRRISLEVFIPYMRYALLYYATTRYLNGRDYRVLLDKITVLDTFHKGSV